MQSVFTVVIVIVIIGSSHMITNIFLPKKTNLHTDQTGWSEAIDKIQHSAVNSLTASIHAIPLLWYQTHRTWSFHFQRHWR
jgi:hypothetical protein